MKKMLPQGRFRIVLSVLGVCLLFGAVLSFSEKTSSRDFLAQIPFVVEQSTIDSAWPIFKESEHANHEGETGTLQKMIVENGTATIDLDFGKINGEVAKARNTSLRFDVEPNAFFKVLVFNDEFRGSLPSSMRIVPQSSVKLPASLSSSSNQMVVESLPWGGEYDMAVRDGKTGFTFFNMEGYQFEYDAAQNLLNIVGGRLLMSEEYAAQLGRPSDAGKVVGDISISTKMRSIETSTVANGEVTADVLPASTSPETGTVPGPDVIVGDLTGLVQYGITGTQVGLSVGTDSCNFGTVDLGWFANPNNDHPVIPQNLYRMSGGAGNDERFEQIGQSSVKHAFTALTNNICSLGCNGIGGSRLGSGCSDPYTSSLNSGPSLGSRAWINPFTGFFPRNDSGTPNNSHSGAGHATDSGAGHRVRTEIADLTPSLNPGATYYAESQYVTPHEYVWCQANPTQCNMFNNVSYRRYNVVNSVSPFSFSPAAATVRQKTAISSWPGSTSSEVRPDSADGLAAIAYKVTNPSPGVWHYEYAIYNQNLDRAIQSLSIPVGAGVTISNVGFHAPPQHPGSAADGTLGSAGFSSTPWAQTQTADTMTWSSETFAQNQNANAVRWGTLYNIRFDSNRPPMAATATVGFLKTGTPMTVAIQAPTPAIAANVSISGRVTNAFGQGQANVRISLVDGELGGRKSTITSSLGYYQFENLAGGATYTLNALSKRYTYEPRSVLANDNIFDFDFTPAP